MTSTQVEQDNIQLVRRGFEAFAKGDMAVLGELFDPQAVWHSPSAGVLTGEYHGRDAIFAMFGQLHQETAGTFSSKPISFAASGGEVFVRTEVAGKRNGCELHGGEVIVFTIASGRVREVRLYIADYPASATFWS